MANPKPADTATKYYFCQDATLSVFYFDEMDEGSGLVYLGTSDNPNPKMAMAAFTQSGKVNKGYRLIHPS